MKREETNIDIVLAQNGIRTDKALAEQMGITQQRLSYALKGNITLKTLEKIATHFGLHVKDLIK